MKNKLNIEIVEDFGNIRIECEEGNIECSKEGIIEFFGFEELEFGKLLGIKFDEFEGIINDVKFDLIDFINKYKEFYN